MKVRFDRLNEFLAELELEAENVQDKILRITHLAETKDQLPIYSSAMTEAENLKRAFAEHDIPWPNDATLYWHPTGPKISYGGGLLKVDDLNPETHIQFRMSAKDMLRLAWRFFVIAWRIS